MQVDCVNEYREEVNPLIGWWQERTEEAETHISAAELRSDFSATDPKERNISVKAFNKRLRQELGLMVEPVRCGANTAIGVECRKLKGFGGDLGI